MFIGEPSWPLPRCWRQVQPLLPICTSSWTRLPGLVSKQECAHRCREDSLQLTSPSRTSVLLKTNNCSGIFMVLRTAELRSCWDLMLLIPARRNAWKRWSPFPGGSAPKSMFTCLKRSMKWINAKAYTANHLLRCWMTWACLTAARWRLIVFGFQRKISKFWRIKKSGLPTIHPVI